MTSERWNDIVAGHATPAETPEERFLEFRFPTEHPSTLLRRMLDREPYVFAGIVSKSLFFEKIGLTI